MKVRILALFVTLLAAALLCSGVYIYRLDNELDKANTSLGTATEFIKEQHQEIIQLEKENGR